MSKVATIEDSIIQAVNDVLMQPANQKLKEVATLPGAWSYDLLKRVLQKAPCVYVAFLGGQTQKGVREATLDARFDVYAISKQPDEEIRRRGNTRVIGAYDILEAVIPNINDRKVPDVGTLQFNGIDNLFGEAMFDLGGTVYAATFTVPNLTFGYTVDETTLDNFVTFDAIHDIDTSQTGEPLTQDTVTLPQ